MRESGSKTILHVSSVHQPFDTRIFVKECTSLKKAGYNVHLIAQHEKDEVRNDISIHGLPVARKKSERITKVIPALVKEVSSFPKSAVVHIHDPELMVVGLYLKLRGYKIVYDIHEHYPADMLTKEWLPSWLQIASSKVVSILERVADKVFDGIVTVVPPVSKRFNNKNHVEISNYPKLSEYYFKKSNEHSERKMKAIYIGDITYRRGAQQMIDAMAELNRNRDQIIPCVFGGRFSPPEIEADIIKSEGWQYCEFIGWQLMDDIWDQLHEARVGLVTLQPVPSHLLLLPVKMFEYMAAGLPVVASDFPMFREIIEKEECGLLVNPEDPAEIANAIEWIVSNPEEADAMGQRGKKAVLEKYNWDREEKELLDFYTGLFNTSE